MVCIAISASSCQDITDSCLFVFQPQLQVSREVIEVKVIVGLQSYNKQYSDSKSSYQKSIECALSVIQILKDDIHAISRILVRNMLLTILLMSICW